MRLWIFAIVLALVAVYVMYYYRHPKELSVLQTTLADFNFDMLFEKQPIVITDLVQDINVVLQAWFAHSRKVNLEVSAETRWYRNAHKYLLIQARADGELYVVSAARKLAADGAPAEDETLLAVKMREGQLVLLPFRTLFASTAPVYAVGVDDWITRWLPNSQ